MPTRRLVLVTIGRTRPCGRCRALPAPETRHLAGARGSRPRRAAHRSRHARRRAATPCRRPARRAPTEPCCHGIPAVRARAGSPADYRLAIGDKLRVEVYKDPQLSQSLQVRPDGKVTLPLIGDIAGRRPDVYRAAGPDRGALKEYVTNPVVTVIVVETIPPVVYVMGEVTQPGVDSDARTDVGAPGAGDGGRVPRVREHQEHPRAAPQRPRRPDDLVQLQGAVKGDGNPVTLQPGDTVIVP